MMAGTAVACGALSHASPADMAISHNLAVTEPRSTARMGAACDAVKDAVHQLQPDIGR